MLKSINREIHEPIFLHPAPKDRSRLRDSEVDPAEKLFQVVPHYRREEIRVKQAGASVANSLVEMTESPTISPFISSPSPQIDLSSSPSKSAASAIQSNSTSHKRKLFMTCVKNREEQPVTVFTIPQTSRLEQSEQIMTPAAKLV